MSNIKEKNVDNNINNIIESLSPIERKILPFLKSKSISKILEKAEVDKTTCLRALQFLANKGVLELKTKLKEIVQLGVNGIHYQKNELPERKLLNVISGKTMLMQEAKKLSKLSDNEFKAALGALKKKAFAEIKKDRLVCTATKEEITKKMLEEQLIEALPIELGELQPEQLHALNSLKNRKNIVEIKRKKQISFKLTELGEQIAGRDIKKQTGKDLIEQLTPEIIKKGLWKGKKFRRYDIVSPVPKISGGKRHFVNQAVDYARKIWTEMGFEEMTGNLIQEGFWNFDALFTPQDHPVREMQDTFYIKDVKGKLPDKKIVQAVKQAHEKGVAGSKGWQYKWQEDEAKKIILRTHTTCLSALTLAKLQESKKLKDKKGKFFAVGKCFRNETVDWSHGFEFYQTEGIVVDRNVNFRHLLGYLQEFYKKMGFEKIRFAPAYFPYTEPSVEISVWHPEKKLWLELGGAGVFRPEVTIALLREYIPVLAWGQGLDRMITDHYEIKDLRQLYKNNLNQSRKIKFWMK